LIDQFAAAEGRMKWAPNKRLHFEVAVIKAIQTLNQVTLNEVIENLAALRDGKSQTPTPVPAKSSPKTAAAPLAKDAPRVAEQVQQTSVVREEPPLPPTQAIASVDHETVWQKMVEQVRGRRRLISPWVEAATALGTEGRFFLIGFPPQQKTAMESLSIPRTREFLEALLKELSGQDWKIKFVLKEGLPIVAPAEAPAAPAPKKQETQTAFKDDPLIREALEIFKGEIKTVSD
jgi:DNA polymerase-3 subunit gamma/tau